MIGMEANKIAITDEALRRGAEEGMDGFLKVFIDKYLEVTGGVVNAETMPLLNGYQHSLLGYHFLREEKENVLVGIKGIRGLYSAILGYRLKNENAIDCVSFSEDIKQAVITLEHYGLFLEEIVCKKFIVSQLDSLVKKPRRML